MFAGMIHPSDRLAVVASALSDDPREALRLSRSAGFSGVQFDAFSSSFSLTDLSQTGRREFRHMLASNDQQLVGLRVDVGPKGFGPGADIDRLLSQFTKVMEAAKALAAPLICVETGPLPEPPASKKPKPRVTPEQAGLIIIPDLNSPPPPADGPPARAPDPSFVSQVDSVLMELGGRADQMGVMLALRSDLSSFAAIDSAITAANCQWLGIDLDPVALLRDEWPADEIFSRFGNLIRHVRARDADVGSARRTRPAIIGQGSTHWAELLQSLDQAGYRGWLTIDPMELSDHPAAAATGLAHLRS